MSALPATCRRIHLALEGRVQGVGFRPYVGRLARHHELNGWVANGPADVQLEVEGRQASIERFVDVLLADLPPLARIDRVQQREKPLQRDTRFEIRASEGRNSHGSVGAPTNATTKLGAAVMALSMDRVHTDISEVQATLMPDVAVCSRCLDEMADPANRRYRYPFISCTDCGPRYSILDSLPFDRGNTTLRNFPMCAACRIEYESPDDRRFHAQTTTCCRCGPRLVWLNAGEPMQGVDHTAVLQAADALREGCIVAIKGSGGFQLLADAHNDASVRRLRERKGRPDKPFALMMANLDQVRQFCHLSDLEASLLASPQTPVVLSQARAEPLSGKPSLSSRVAPDNPWLGVMLPATPLHHLLMQELDFPVIATSGNRSGSPLIIDEAEALMELDGLADGFLMHDLPIARALDDSVVRVVAGRALVLRRARGYVPDAIVIPGVRTSILALGAHQKVAPVLAAQGLAQPGAPVGDLDTALARARFQDSLNALERLHDCRATTVACDLHPDYHTSQVAKGMQRAILRVPHHLAHVMACVAEHQVQGPVLGFSWDGTGLGEDGTLWGGECLRVDGLSVERVAHLNRFRLPGGEMTARQPARCAFGVLAEVFGIGFLDDAPSGGLTALPCASQLSVAERRLLRPMLERGIQAPWTTSAGRLFDAVAALLGLMQITSFEGQAAMALEYLAERADPVEGYAFVFAPVESGSTGARVIDWHPAIRQLVIDIDTGISSAIIARRFHQTLIDVIVSVASAQDERQIILAGGCFQNRLLTEGAVSGLQNSGFDVFWPDRMPPNDGALALGQAAWVARVLGKEES